MISFFIYSKLLPYGLGSSLSRRRRSTDRCECLSAADKTCHGFCHKRWKLLPFQLFFLLLPTPEAKLAFPLTYPHLPPRLYQSSLCVSFQSVSDLCDEPENMSMGRVSHREMIVAVQYEGSSRSNKKGPHTCWRPWKKSQRFISRAAIFGKFTFLLLCKGMIDVLWDVLAM